MAVIKLTSSIGSTTGWLGMMSSNSFNVNLNAIGYPGDKAWPTEYYYYCPGVSDSDSSDSVTKNTCDIWPGQSGRLVGWPCKNRIVVLSGSSKLSDRGTQARKV